MIDREAIEALQASAAIDSAASAVSRSTDNQHIVMLPSDFTQHDLEKFQPTRRRARGTMSTPVLASFAAYAKAHAEDGATVFVNPGDATATALLNLGNPEKPGHADNRARFATEKTAAYQALLAIANGAVRKQSDIAEFLEDWPDLVQCFNAEGAIANPRAIAAIRKLSIEAIRKIESEEQSLSASRSAFESVAATSKEPLPTTIYFTCQPYTDLEARTFVMRLAVLTGNDKPAISLRIVKQEEHQQEMAREIAEKVTAAFDGADIPVLLGQYSPS